MSRNDGSELWYVLGVVLIGLIVVGFMTWAAIKYDPKTYEGQVFEYKVVFRTVDYVVERQGNAFNSFLGLGEIEGTRTYYLNEDFVLNYPPCEEVVMVLETRCSQMVEVFDVLLKFENGQEHWHREESGIIPTLGRKVRGTFSNNKLTNLEYN